MVHDWISWKRRTNYKGNLPPSHKIFMSYKIDNKYSPLSEYEIRNWFLKRSDTKLITDKLNNYERIYKAFSDFKNRLIVELFTNKSIDYALSTNDSNILISERILREKKFSKKYLSILSKKNVRPYGFAVHNNKVYENPSFFKLAKSYGFKIFVYGMNNNKLFNDEKDVLCDLSNYITGIYSDKTLANIDLIESYCN